MMVEAQSVLYLWLKKLSIAEDAEAHLKTSVLRYTNLNLTVPEKYMMAYKLKMQILGRKVIYQ